MNEQSNLYMNIDLLGRIYLKDTIVYYDKPLVFSCINDFGQIFIAISNELDETESWTFLPVSNSRFLQIVRGGITAYNAIRNPEGGFLWSVNISANNYSNGKAKQIDPECLDEDDLPDKDIVYDIYGEDEFIIKNEELKKIQEDAISERREIIDISLEPMDSHIHEIDVMLLSKVLENTQNVINLIGHNKGINGKIPKTVREKNKLNATGNYAASFGIRLKSNELADIMNQSIVQRNIGIFLDIIEAKDDLKRLHEILNSLNPSVSIYYMKLLRYLINDNIGIKIQTAFPNRQCRNITLNKDEIQRSLKVLEEDFKEVVRNVTIFGSVIAIDVDRKSFGFISNDDEKIRGVIDSKLNVRQYVLPKTAEILVQVTTKYVDLTGKETIEYKLLDLNYLE